MQVVLGIILGIIIAFTYKGFFGNDLLDQAEARNVELARQLKEALKDNKELKELRKQTERNNTIILERNRKQTKLIKEIEELSTINAYDNEKAILSKIKELILDYQSKKLVQKIHT